MKRLFPLFLVGLSFQFAQPRELAVPQRLGVYIADVERGNVRFLGDFSEWQLSPDGRYIVGGRERGIRAPFYEVGVVSTSGDAMRQLERFSIESPTDAAFHWSSDSARVRVEADRNDDGKNEFKTFSIGHASTVRAIRTPKQSLSTSAMRRLKVRFPKVSDVCFSPDGKRVVAYLSRSTYDKPNFDGGFWTFKPDGTNLKRLTRNLPLPKHDCWDVEPHWLPNSKRLAFRRTSFEDEGI